MDRLTIVVPTYNRAATLARALRSLVAARAAASHVPAEIVVVDNNSTDDTAAIVKEAAGYGVRYVLERRQGLSHARNAGIAAAGDADLIAFTDDDVEVDLNWISVLARAFANEPAVECVGGRVLPRWKTTPPAWLTRDHWAPLALQDHGDSARTFDRANPVCLIGANLAFRRNVFDCVGLFSTDVQRVRDGIGSTEDHELLRRLYGAGGRAGYVPDLVVTAEVPEERLAPAYHRRWHRGHGRFHAVMRLPEVEQSRRRLLGVPAHLIRSAAADAAEWVRLRVSGDSARAFAAETRLWFFSGFLRERVLCLPRR